MNPPVPPGVAAGHELTASVGLSTLRAGGNAADAACAMILTGCVTETIYTGLGGGGFATYYDAETKSVNARSAAALGARREPTCRGTRRARPSTGSMTAPRFACRRG